MPRLWLGLSPVLGTLGLTLLWSPPLPWVLSQDCGLWVGRREPAGGGPSGLEQGWPMLQGVAGEVEEGGEHPLSLQW